MTLTSSDSHNNVSSLTEISCWGDDIHSREGSMHSAMLSVGLAMDNSCAKKRGVKR